MRHSRLRIPVLLGLLVLPALPPVLAQPAPAPPLSVERLARVGKLWGTVRYLHPWLAYKEIDWDAALVQAVPKVRAAETPEQYAAAVGTMLAALGDPVTRVQPRNQETAGETKTGEPPPLFRWLDEKTIVVDLRAYPSFPGMLKLRPRLNELAGELAKAERAVLDLRVHGIDRARGDDASFEYTLQALQPILARRTVTAPAQRYLMHSGYRPQEGGTSGGYWSGFVTLFADTFGPGSIEKGPGRVAFLVSRDTVLPPIALALQASGDGVLVADGDLDADSPVARRTVDLGEGFEAEVRVSEILPLPGWPGVHADARISPSASDEEAVRAAVAALQEKKKPATGSPSPRPEAVARPDETYREMLDPALEYRILAVVRAWNVIQWFYPYKHLIGDWDAVLPEFIARMEEVQDGRGYALTVAEMMARVPDGHTSVFGRPELDAELYGDAGVPVAVRWIEGKWVVTGLGDDPALKEAGIAVGDVLTALDGQPVEAREERLRRTLTASTEWGLRERLRRGLLGGPAGSAATLTLEGRDGASREVQLQRDKKYRGFNPQAVGETVRILPGNLGYVDLTRLTVEAVDGMFETLKDTRGIVFDMRGYPRGVFTALSPRLNTRNARYAATFRRSQVSAFSLEEEDSGFYFSQPIPETDQRKYTGKTVMLIDERAISQAEHTGLFLEAANGTKFVGTPTAGANGDVTVFTLPGSLQVAFTGHDVRHADGRQLQRVGLVPDVQVAPTIAGLRAGKDEVLDRAVEVLNQELAGVAGSP